MMLFAFSLSRPLHLCDLAFSLWSLGQGFTVCDHISGRNQNKWSSDMEGSQRPCRPLGLTPFTSKHSLPSSIFLCMRHLPFSHKHFHLRSLFSSWRILLFLARASSAILFLEASDFLTRARAYTHCHFRAFVLLFLLTCTALSSYR